MRRFFVAPPQADQLGVVRDEFRVFVEVPSLPFTAVAISMATISSVESASQGPVDVELLIHQPVFGADR
jgi:hypothetical protein